MENDECKHQYIEKNGYMVCIKCGLIEDRVISYSVPPIYNIEEWNEKAQNSAYNSIVTYRKIFSKYDWKGDFIPYKNLYQFKRLSRINESSSTSSGRNLRMYTTMAVKLIKLISNDIPVPVHIRQEALTLFLKAVNEGMLRGRTKEAFVIAVLWETLRRWGFYYPLSVFVKYIQKNEREVVSVLKVLRKRNINKSTEVNIESYIRFYVEKLGKNYGFIEKALSLFRIITKLGYNSNGRNPRAVACAVIYPLLKREGKAPSQSKLAKIFGISEVTIRARSKEVEKYIKMYQDINIPTDNELPVSKGSGLLS